MNVDASRPIPAFSPRAARPEPNREVASPPSSFLRPLGVLYVSAPAFVRVSRSAPEAYAPLFCILGHENEAHPLPFQSSTHSFAKTQGWHSAWFSLFNSSTFNRELSLSLLESALTDKHRVSPDFWPRSSVRKSFRIRTYTKSCCNPLRIRTYEKTGGWGMLC